jgi:hypothetical protein
MDANRLLNDHPRHFDDYQAISLFHHVEENSQEKAAGKEKGKSRQEAELRPRLIRHLPSATANWNHR